MLGAFNMLETSLLITLAITLILIMFIIYHYKQRIITTEEKTDTMFDIINNMAQEMTNIRNTMSIILPKPTTPIQSINKVLVSDDTESDSDSDSDSEYDSEQHDINTEDAAYNSDSDISNNDSDISNNDSDISNGNEFGNVKHISMELTNNIDNNIDSTHGNEHFDIIDEPEVNNIELNNADNTIVEKINDLDEKEIKRKNYRKMTISNLKEEVLAIGYKEDISKLKKNDLIDILDNIK